MYPSPCSDSSTSSSQADADSKTAHLDLSKRDDRIYQGLTIAAMLLSLASLWLFW